MKLNFEQEPRGTSNITSLAGLLGDFRSTTFGLRSLMVRLFVRDEEAESHSREAGRSFRATRGETF